MHIALTTLVLPLILSALVPAQKLEEGQPAPSLTIEKWVKGKPIESLEEGKIYVVEFWATWCGPCIRGIPHLNALQERYAKDGVTIIGLTSADSRGNSLDAVEKFVEKQGDAMGYTVAWDKGRTTNAAYMQAARQSGIPCSFLIDRQGKIVYIGHPYFLDFPLAKVAAGTWDPRTGPKQFKDVRKRLEKISRKKPADAAKELATLASKYPEMKPMAAERLVEIVSELAKSDSRSDRSLAIKVAKQAAKLTDEKDAHVLDALADAYFKSKNLGKAAEAQQRAIDLEDTPARRKSLARYQGTGTTDR